jgi:hypothetical protein
MYGLENSKFVLEHVDQLKCWSMVLGSEVSLNQLITSPFRLDNKPTCYLRDYNGVVLFTDWAFPSFNKYTVVHALAHLKGTTFTQASQILYDFVYHNVLISVNNNIVITDTILTLTGERKHIYYETYTYDGQVSYTQLDEDYWARRKVKFPELLATQQPCYSIYKYWIDGKAYYPKTYPCYALTFNESQNFKMYCPYAENRFPLSTATSSDVWKWKSHTSACVITKSYKDAYLVNKITGIDTYAFQSEGIIPKDLSFLSQYKTKLIVYDNDKAGIEGSNILKQKLDDAKQMYYPKQLGKDTDDLVVRNMENIVYQMINTAIQ